MINDVHGMKFILMTMQKWRRTDCICCV